MKTTLLWLAGTLIFVSGCKFLPPHSATPQLGTLSEPSVSTVLRYQPHSPSGGLSFQAWLDMETVIEQRLVQAGVTRANIQLEPGDKVRVELPDLLSDQISGVKTALSHRGEVALYVLADDELQNRATMKQTLAAQESYEQLKEGGQTQRTATPPPRTVLRGAPGSANDGVPMLALREFHTHIDPLPVTEAYRSKDSDGNPGVAFVTDPSVLDRLHVVSEFAVGKKVAIVVDDYVRWVVQLEEPLDGAGLITGVDHAEDKEELLRLLGLGTLPAPLRLLSQTSP